MPPGEANGHPRYTTQPLRSQVMLACRLLGHRPRFTSEGATMRWACERCGVGGEKRYGTAREAERYARALDREDRESLGERAPLIGLLPLRMFRRLQKRHGTSVR
jgi:hypothetical protein